MGICHLVSKPRDRAVPERRRIWLARVVSCRDLASNPMDQGRMDRIEIERQCFMEVLERCEGLPTREAQTPIPRGVIHPEVEVEVEAEAEAEASGLQNGARQRVPVRRRKGRKRKRR